jgi:hypothetical protein
LDGLAGPALAVAVVDVLARWLATLRDILDVAATAIASVDLTVIVVVSGVLARSQLAIA